MENRKDRGLIGRNNRSNGAAFEQLIDLACRKYEELGIAEIMKVPEPVAVLGPLDANGRFTACFTKKAQPDYRGTYRNGQSLLFEAKHTSQKTVHASIVNEEQGNRFAVAERMKACCFVLVSLDFRRYFRIPWAIWKDMKTRFGRACLTETDMEPYEVKFRRGFLDFLGTS